MNENNNSNQRFNYLDKLNMAAFLAQLIDMVDNEKLENFLRDELLKLHDEHFKILQRLDEIERIIKIWN